MYWTLTPEERRHLSEKRAYYVASAQLQKVKPGDVLWLVNVYLNELLLIGRLQVETVVSDSEIAQELVEDTDDWIEADWYAIANRYHAEPMREVNITYLVDSLRFNSPAYRLDTSEGRINPQQFRALRELTGESAELIEHTWYSEDEHIPSVQDVLELTEDDSAYAEGRLIIRTLRQRQRNRKLVADAKAQYKRQHGRLTCQACGFDFAETYGIEYIEAHHLLPVSSLTDEHQTQLDDIVMLCANCHRMIHSQTPPLSLEALKDLLNSHKKVNEHDHNDHTTRH